ncbi:ribosomal RNA-processing protein 9, partial [Phenoliferia sp. Uapishka_3]
PLHSTQLILPIPFSSIHTTPSKSHRGPITAAVASEDGHYLYTSSKDGSIIKWDMSSILSSSPSPPSLSSSVDSPSLPAASSSRITKSVYFPKRPSESAKRNPQISKAAKMEAAAQAKLANGGKKGKERGFDAGGHTDEVLCLALSADGKVLASGGKDKSVGVWDVSGEKGKWLRGLGGHKDRVASITFRLGTLQLYSSSFDRTLKVFDLSTLSYVETLFGHQDCIQHVNALRGEIAVSAGGRDKTIRFWKVTEESQLVFRGGVASRIRNVLDGAMEEDGVEVEEKGRRRNRGEIKYVEGSVDCVAMVDDTTFVSGGDSGSLCLWSITKKKPISTVQLAHGVNEYASESEGVIGTARWITALACLPYGDTFASGAFLSPPLPSPLPLTLSSLFPGSWDGQIRLWAIDSRIRSFTALTTIPAIGYINSLQLISPSLRSSEPQSQRAKSGSAKEEKSLVVVAACSKEPRLGRWMRIKEGKEGAVVAVIRVRGDGGLLE